ncbi:unnamed protein product, partial [Symbiodinium microadriaticum]
SPQSSPLSADTAASLAGSSSKRRVSDDATAQSGRHLSTCTARTGLESLCTGSSQLPTFAFRSDSICREEDSGPFAPRPFASNHAF